MERASRVMYTIANVFTWIIVLCSIVGIVFSILRMTGVVEPIEGIEFCIGLLRERKNSCNKWVVKDNKMSLEREYFLADDIELTANIELNPFNLCPLKS